MSTRAEKIAIATKPITQWLGHYQPKSVIAIDEDGEEHPIAVTKNKRKWHIVAKAIESLDAVTVRAIGEDGSIVATRKLRTVDIAQTEEETAATPATAGGFDVTAVVSIVAKEFRETTAVMREMVADVVKAQAQMLKDMGERHSAAEKALLEAREQIMAEREERLEEREAVAERAAADAEREAERVAAEAERADKVQEQALVMKVVEMVGPQVLAKLAPAMNGAAPAKAVAPAVTPPVVKPDA